MKYTEETARVAAWLAIGQGRSHLRDLTLEEIQLGNETFNRLLGNQEDEAVANG